ncbi:nucleoside deaminase, partial [candidate division KSB1 bacterium]
MADHPLPPEKSPPKAPFETFGQPDHEHWMREALKEARLAEAKEEVPIGCVIVHNGVVIGRGHNQTESLQDPTA